LRPPGTQISPEHRAQIEAGRERFNEMAKRQYGLDIKEGPFGINSIPSLVGEKFAVTKGKGPEYHHVVESAYWLESLNIEDLHILRALAEKAGLDGDEFITALSNPKYQEEVNSDIQFAYQNGLQGVPALIFNNKYLVSGAQPYEVLLDIVRQVEEKSGEDAEIDADDSDDLDQ
jgi:predicted DsbA family dithiol-disulfide isomerase